MNLRIIFLLSCAHLLLMMPAICVASPPQDAAPSEKTIRFSRDVLPILSDTCFACHGPDEGSRKAKLRLDTQSAAFGKGKSGETAIVPGDPLKSEVIARIFSDDKDDVMPPPKALRQLTKEQREVLQRWVAEGAVWGQHWAYEMPQQPPVPKGGAFDHVAPSHNAIDEFVRARLASEGLAPSPEATKRTLIRRLTLDLVGLPPRPEEVEAFVRDASADAYEKVVDRLLSSPAYGERWAWDWLDAARYSDTNGFQGDPERTMWPWRDWVVGAINRNMPYDQFTVEQLAGDLFPDAAHSQKLASGFHRNNMHNGEGGRIAEETRVENVFDRVETTATIWMGATFTCCRCHDHKYDPFTLKDYFGLYDIFNQMSETGQGRGGQAPPVINMATSADQERIDVADAKVQAMAKEVEAFEWIKFPRDAGKPLVESDASKLPGNLSATLAKVEPKNRGVDALLEAIGYFETDGKDAEYVKVLKRLLAVVRAKVSAQNSVPKVMIMDQLPKARQTFILNKGAYDKPTDIVVQGAVPALLVEKTDGEAGQRLTRLELAQWLVSPRNPLTARVTVNRFWQAFFGTGLVKTVEDFGLQGEKPSHPELLDWLATDFVASGWDVKALHKKIVMSATYRQASKLTPHLLERDPENRLLARASRYRMPSWLLRDVALATSGLLSTKMGGPAVKPYQPEGIWEEATFGKKTYQQDHGESLYRRSLYIFWRRIVAPTMFFDNATRQTCTVKSLRTNTPLHALTTLNDITYVEAARVLAQRTMEHTADSDAQLERIFQIVLSRPPSPPELEIVKSRWEILRQQYAADPESAKGLLAVGEFPRNENLPAVEHAALTGICQLVLNLDEALTKE